MKFSSNLPKIALIILFIPFLLSSCKKEPAPAAEEVVEVKEPTQEELIAQGEYLVGIMGCHDCHSPKRMGEKGPEIIPELMLSGYPSDRPQAPLKHELIKEGFAMFYPDLTASVGPWGGSFAANLTPHESGIGNWTEEQFKRALTQGKAKGMENGRMLLPPMPWMNYANMKDEDVRAVYTYLKSINPVENVVPAPVAPDGM
ncbi:c-type cytochrome [Lutimonas zeaxanthinifaciens]|uniref:c-type cytochrome n=1 Tax=Lutimonas zeaxanthinifaciens TaxID=3060215 RepID=UPI00265CAA67|nr:c-type cytochrome [Lutimonas sp. YSD2104]WKK67493.1 c-type cytochrome [Lutimonas sp. YSD2104]